MKKLANFSCGRITRRECVRVAGLAALVGTVPAAASDKLAPARRIFVAGGGILAGDPEFRLLAGESAGMNCWFEQAVGDSRPERLSVLECLGWLKGSACPHYHNESDRWKLGFHQLLRDGQIKDGLACDDGAGVLFEGESAARVVTISPKAAAYKVRRNGTQVTEEVLKADLLGKAP